MKERRKRELGPVLELLEDLKSAEIGEDGGEHFKKVVGDIHTFGESTNKMLDKMVKADEHWFTGSLMKFLVKK
jgi:hypothetical protein